MSRAVHVVEFRIRGKGHELLRQATEELTTARGALERARKLFVKLLEREIELATRAPRKAAKRLRKRVVK